MQKKRFRNLTKIISCEAVLTRPDREQLLGSSVLNGSFGNCTKLRDIRIQTSQSGETLSIYLKLKEANALEIGLV